MTIILDDDSSNKTFFPKKTGCQKSVLFSIIQEMNFLWVAVMSGATMRLESLQQRANLVKIKLAPQNLNLHNDQET